MKNKWIRPLALILVFLLLVPSSAEGEGFFSFVGSLFSGSSYVAYSDMEYTRPDLELLQQVLDEACLRAQGTDAASILDAVFRFYDEYDWFFTASALASIGYSSDLSSQYWEEEYAFCSNAGPTVLQMLDSLNACLAVSPCRKKLERIYFGDGFFDAYDGEQLLDDGLVALMEEESRLISQYYSQCSQMNSWIGRLFFRYEDMAQTLVDLIGVRNQIAEYNGYDSYERFVNDCYYYRDYSPEEMAAYLEEIRAFLVPLYQDTRQNVPKFQDMEISQALSYVRTAAEAMGGIVENAFALMEQASLYDIEPGKNKHDTSFETYLTSYQEPFLFLNPSGTEDDCLLLAHEFGHFCNDYASNGSVVSIDVSEIFSQGFEYLSLCYHPEARNLIQYKMLDSLSIYVEEACYAKFEQEIYLMEEPTPEKLCMLYQSICEEYGMNDGSFFLWDFVNVPHFYIDPMYVSSYIISNDAALQLYQVELENPGKGLELYEKNLDTQQPYFLAFLEEAGLESPFAPGRLEEAAATLGAVFSAA